MIAEFGHFALILALVVSALQGVVPLVGAARRDAAAIDFARHAALVQFAALATAFFSFMYLHVTSDFSVLNVVQNSHTAKPMLYKISGVWGSHEGSMLLWVFMLGLYGALVAALGRELPATLRARVLAVQGLLGFGLLAFIVLTSNPFLRIFPPPVDGNDLNPLLQDPGLAFHPPFLYFGYVGFSITYSFAVAALLEGRIDAAWARWVRRWALLAWCGLTIGIAMGSWWAYYVLGWGGWWVWDPVENASFMPWLLGTALLHSVAVLEKREGMTRWTILLAILTFGMSLVGTFLVRSGVLTSVHAFALDPARGEFVLLLLVLIIGAALALYAWRIPRLLPGTGFDPVSREGALVVNNMLFSIGMVTVFLGTFYPLFAELANGVRLSVGPQFFNATFLPVMAPAVAIMVLAPMMSWRRGDLKATLRRLIPAAIAAVVVPLIALAVAPLAPIYAYGGLALATWAVAGVVTDVAWRCRFRDGGFWAGLRRFRQLPRRLLGGSLAHFGVGILVAGIAVSTAWREESLEVMVPGQSLAFAGRTVTLVEVTEGQSENYQWQRARLQMVTPDGQTRFMSPERRFYPVAGSQTTNTAISTTGFADLYAALGDPDTKGGWVVRLYFNPLVPWIWFGAILSALGGMIALVERKAARRTVSVPADGTVKP